MLENIGRREQLLMLGIAIAILVAAYGLVYLLH